MKRIAYFTTDPLNAATAEKLAARFGLDVDIVEPRDLPRLERERTELVVDWDYVPRDYQNKLLNSTGAKIVAIHGYNIGDGPSSFLPKRGIYCSRRLDHHLLRAVTGSASAA